MIKNPARKSSGFFYAFSKCCKTGLLATYNVTITFSIILSIQVKNYFEGEFQVSIRQEFSRTQIAQI
ncbi:hypothetical protein DQM68_04470 [Leptospira mayottensis]|nr:hypothetical protein DQM68_04470 [Leptospira mayottensis]